MKEFFIRRTPSDHRPGSERCTLIRVNDDGEILAVDSHCDSVLGYDSSELEGETVHRILAARQDDPFAPTHRQKLENGESVLITFRHKEGFFFTAALGLSTQTNDADSLNEARISQRGNAPIDLRLMRLAENSAGFGTWELDIASNDVTWSDGMYQLLELRPGSQITPDQAMFYCQESQSRIRALTRRCIRTAQSFSIPVTLTTARQNVRQVKLTGRALKSGDRIQRLVGTMVDQTHEYHRVLDRQQAEKLLSATMSATEDLIVAVDKNLNFLRFNQPFEKAFEKIFQKTPKPGDNLSVLLADFPNERRLSERLWQRAFERDSYVVELPLTEKEERLPLYEIHYQRLIGANGEVTGAVQVARDISHRVHNASSGDHRLQHDPTTGLINRKTFLSRLRRSLQQKARRDGADSLLYLDLDSFESFNDIAGHGVADRYLRELASNLGVKVRQRDALARLSGNTFALLIENCPEARARKIADEILELIRNFIFSWQDRQLQTTASGGLLFMGGNTPSDPEQLLTQAADLCHTAKTSGRNRIHAAPALKQDMDESTTNRLLERIHYALDQNALILEYQTMKPVASVTWGDHIEILARLPGETEGEPALQPDQFLPIAERFDLSKRLDRHVIRQTLAWLGRQRLLEPRLKYCGFNLSLASVLDDRFADFVAATLRESAYAPDVFCFEIREAHATQYPDEVAVLCDTLHGVGCRVALEGAGASVESYGLAARLPVDIIKLDQKIMEHLNDDPVQQVMVEALHRIAEAAGKTTVATFIESDDALRKVRTLGVHYGQGFRLSRPRPLDELKPAEVQLSTGNIGG
ncbi:EAL domain-containing protein [Marinobacter confluentis]|uniref:EAL domain-containing protein n=1 Tax=Marinobacter confluentis TaxID=1697557 RepID=A0A4Z1C023_9GAMM|nr:EAL domain-containing protein [Marinobacter confluentis]TGN38039.1 EAL domain-containing protein [Marinobacter confluentis]